MTAIYSSAETFTDIASTASTGDKFDLQGRHHLAIGIDRLELGALTSVGISIELSVDASQWWRLRSVDDELTDWSVSFTADVNTGTSPITAGSGALILVTNSTGGISGGGAMGAAPFARLVVTSVGSPAAGSELIARLIAF